MNDGTAFINTQTLKSKWYVKFAIFFVCMLAGLFVPLFGIPLMLFTLLLLSVATPKTKQLVKIAIVLFVLGAFTFPFAVRADVQPVVWVILFLPYIASPLLLLAVFAIQLFRKPPQGWVAIIIMSPFVLGCILLNARTYLISALPYIYMPPALSNENLKVYDECIKYVENHSELKNFIFKRRRLDVRKRPYDPNVSQALGKVLLRISNEPETGVIANQIEQIMCNQFERVDDVILFYKGSGPFLPMTAKEIWHILPSGHGVAYSLNGQDPNQSNDPIIVKYKPFTRTSGNWYISRGLLMRGDGRTYSPMEAISSTLIDRSLKIGGIDPNELHKLD